MSKLSRKSALLFGAILAVCAFAVPSMASAASWGVIGTTHVLDSSNLSFTAPSIVGNVGSSCADSQFHVDVRSAAVLTVTGATFRNCSGTGASINCTVTVTATRLHWSGTGLAENDLRINGVHVDALFENKPGLTCATPGNVTLTGTLGTGAAGTTTWDALAHQVTIENAPGLTAHTTQLGALNATVTGTIRDTAQTLTLT